MPLWLCCGAIATQKLDLALKEGNSKIVERRRQGAERLGDERQARYCGPLLARGLSQGNTLKAELADGTTDEPEKIERN
jgi:hypothetical protein